MNIKVRFFLENIGKLVHVSSKLFRTFIKYKCGNDVYDHLPYGVILWWNVFTGGHTMRSPSHPDSNLYNPILAPSSTLLVTKTDF